MTNERLRELLLPPPHGITYQDDHGIWWAAWYDHAWRLIRKRLVDVRTRRQANVVAREIVEGYIDAHRVNLARKQSASPDEIEEAADYASFPRAIVKAKVQRVCSILAKDFPNDKNTVTRAPRYPGVHVFSYQTGISDREVRRILEDEMRITVSRTIVEKICNHTDYLPFDFVDEALQWAGKEADWKDRVGQLDAWPFGYNSEILRDTTGEEEEEAA